MVRLVVMQQALSNAGVGCRNPKTVISCRGRNLERGLYDAEESMLLKQKGQPARQKNCGCWSVNDGALLDKNGRVKGQTITGFGGFEALSLRKIGADLSPKNPVVWWEPCLKSLA